MILHAYHHPLTKVGGSFASVAAAARTDSRLSKTAAFIELLKLVTVRPPLNTAGESQDSAVATENDVRWGDQSRGRESDGGGEEGDEEN